MTSVSDLAIVLSRVDYGERDRILTMITASHGKLSALAKGVRAGKSKLAGGVELFAENELILIKGRSNLYTLTSSRMKQSWRGVASNVAASAYAYESLVNVNKLTQEEAGSEYYVYLKELMLALNNDDADINQIGIWFTLKLLKCLGVMPNLKTLSNGERVPPGRNYQFDFDKQCFFIKNSGGFNMDHIKILRYHAAKEKYAMINKCPTDIALETEKLVKLLLQQHLQ